ncbi:MAG: hypothetical protein WCS70_02070 [Verrucomicrobiota bacterium]
MTVVTLAMPGVLPAKEIAESSKFKIPLTRTGSNDDVAGSADFSSKSGRSTFRIKIKNGPASQEVELRVGGVSRGTFLTSSKGTVNITLSGAALDFDPRGREIEIEDSGDDKFLSGGGTNTNVGASADERANLTPTGIQPAASGHATYRVKKGAGRFNVEIEDVIDGTYDILVAGAARGTITAVGGIGEVEFGDDNGGPALDFDPVGKLLQIALNGEIILSSTFLADAPGVSVCAPAETTTGLTPLASGSGDARYRIRDDCRRDFRVEIEDVPVGAYDLFVDAINRGTINVVVQSNLNVQGEIEFSSELDDSPSDELPLDFDPTGAAIEIRQGTNVFFTATGGTTTTGTCSVVDNELDLINQGLDGDAKGKSRFRQDVDCGRDLRVEVEKLPVGSYDLKVGGLLRGTISVVVSNSDTFGEIEFDTEPSPGKVLLNFDPRGQAVDVLQGTNLFLTVTMPN